MHLDFSDGMNERFCTCTCDLRRLDQKEEFGMLFKYMLKLIIFVFMVSASVEATDLSFNPNAREMRLMPSYCKAKFTAPQGSPEWQAWRGRIGENFIDLHHYCAALNFVNRYKGARSASDRSYNLKLAMDNFDYMVNALKPNFPLRAELYSNRGNVFKLQGRPREAIQDFNQAIEINPRLTTPYLQLIYLYEGEKKHNQSLEVAINGLRNNPNSKALQRRYLKVGGKLPYPKPIQAEEVAMEPVSKTEAGASESVPTPVDTPTVPVAQPKIGSPTNPYCRFCPPED